jgi:hypothetical protein
MKWENLTEAQIAWILWNLHERLNSLLWDRYEKEFLNWVMNENERMEMEKMLSEEFDHLSEPEF